ncbi:hypothetical protein [Nocardia goodfellowii]|uniref:Uncharacterized protein n=1 Tax=Nocardia goodfellowii TaxID=882446 RepID=A0ABS4QS83_9NOCA|nr:hypothetical protein [Nocardia goodfellowii]MBP2194537.1 hypothetical protein [Nocardia goodfellowii]
MVKVGDKVTLGAGGVSIFEVLAIEGESARIESVLDAPGRYPFSMPIRFLVPAEDRDA